MVADANTCFNDIQIKAANKYRNTHAAGKLKYNALLAAAFQKMMTADAVGTG